VTIAANCIDCPACRVAELGDIDIDTVIVGVILPSTAMPERGTVICCDQACGLDTGCGKLNIGCGKPMTSTAIVSIPAYVPTVFGVNTTFSWTVWAGSRTIGHVEP
jgi:hypothetical protein